MYSLMLRQYTSVRSSFRQHFELKFTQIGKSQHPLIARHSSSLNPADAPKSAEKSPEEQEDWFVDPAYADTDRKLQASLEKTSGPRWMQSTAASQTSPLVMEFMKQPKMPLDASLIAEFIMDHFKAQDVCVLDVRERCVWTDHMVIVEGLNESHTHRLAEGFLQAVKQRRRLVADKGTESTEKAFTAGTASDEDVDLKRAPSVPVIEGKGCDDWKLIDLGHVVVHFVTPEARQTYQLERLWSGQEMLEAEGVKQEEEDDYDEEEDDEDDYKNVDGDVVDNKK